MVHGKRKPIDCIGWRDRKNYLELKAKLDRGEKLTSFESILYNNALYELKKYW